MHVCVCTVYVPGAPEGQKRAFGLLELELCMIVNVGN